MIELPPPTGPLLPAPALLPAEVAAGIPFGLDPRLPRAERARPGVTPRLAMEAVLLTALERAPCLISFSGGRDSSALLAVAVHVARRRGLPLPIPATLRFPGDHDADETAWQRIVLDHLGVTERVFVDVADELDVVGPVATTALRRHGLFWPFNAHFHLPIFAAAAGGSVVTGFGGDEVGRASGMAKAERILTGKRGATAREAALMVGLAAAPPVVRRAVHRRRAGDQTHRPWLTEHGRQVVAAGDALNSGGVPIGVSRVLRGYLPRGRYFAVCRDGFAVMAAAHRTVVAHPFLDSTVLAAWAAEGGFGGPGTRAEIMERLVGDLLPHELVTRQTKGTFSRPTVTAIARTFARDWSGQGVDEELVDVARLRAHWLGDDVNLISTTLMQQAWLHDAAARD